VSVRAFKRIKRLLGLEPSAEHSPRVAQRGRVDHVIILDGTMSTLTDGRETNAGLFYKLLCEIAPASHLSLFYEAGVQWQEWRSFRDVITGRGINRQIRRAYGFLASRYHPGDRIFLIGYSRGAFAARSLAGVIDRVGLLRAEAATERNIREIYRYYQTAPHRPAAQAFARANCHAEIRIQLVGVWDTVKALGLRLPVLWRWTEPAHAFHSHHLGNAIRYGFHALALDETREAFAPVLWECPEGWQGDMEQVWFRGCHGDIGGQLGGHEASRPLANIPLVWMLEKVSGCGLSLPEGWRTRFDCDPGAPSVGSLRGWGMMFMMRRRRVVGADKSEALHETALGYHPRATLLPAVQELSGAE